MGEGRGRAGKREEGRSQNKRKRQTYTIIVNTESQSPPEGHIPGLLMCRKIQGQLTFHPE